MSFYRNGTYIAFHAGGTTDPTASDIKYYRMLQAWAAHKHIEFSLINSHDKTAAVRDTSLRATLERSLNKRLKNSKQFLLIVTESTKQDTDWIPFEIAKAVDCYQLPIIAAYPGYDYIMSPGALSQFWPAALKNRIENSTARVIHIPFRKTAVMDALNQFDVFNRDHPTSGYDFYSQATYEYWGYLQPPLAAGTRL